MLMLINPRKQETKLVPLNKNVPLNPGFHLSRVDHILLYTIIIFFGYYGFINSDIFGHVCMKLNYY